MSASGIIVGKKACCCPRGCNHLDLRSWLSPAGKYGQLAVTAQLSGSWYRNSITTPPGCNVSWSASITGSDLDRTGSDPYGMPQWFAPSNQIIGGGSYEAMYGTITGSLTVVGYPTFGAPQLDASAPGCSSGVSSSVGYHLTIGVTFASNDPSESCEFPQSFAGYTDLQGFSVLYVKRCCNFYDGPLGTYTRVGAATVTSGPNTAPPGNPVYEWSFTRTAADTLVVTEEL